MNLIQNLWNVLITEDENLIKYFTFSLCFLEMYSTLSLFTSILNITYSKKQRNLYYFILFICMFLASFIMPEKISVFFTILALPIIVKFVFKTTVLQSILAEVFMFIFTLVIETIYLKLCYFIFKISIENCLNIPIYRLPFMIFIYLTIIFISKSIKYIKFNLDIFEAMNKSQKKLLLFNAFFIIICIALQFYLLIFYNTALPVFVTTISLLSLLLYFFISFYSIIKSITLEKTKKELEQSQLHNKTLELLYSNISAFKHDFSNILTAFGGFIYADNIKGLKTYYDKIIDECHINNNLSTLDPNVINNPAIYNILASKYYKADELGITINLQVFMNLNNLNMNSYDFCRILGILLDNSIEAASKCNDKIINIDIHEIKPQNIQIISIENTYFNPALDISKLSVKGYTSKEDKGSHGIGLWQVDKIIKKTQNAILDTTKNEKYFKQELAIYSH